MPITVDANGIFKKVDYAPHPKQREMHKAKIDHRMRLAACGRRFGKSVIGGNDLLVEAHRAYAMRKSLEPKGRRHEYWIVGPEYTDAEKEFRVLYNGLTRLGIPMDKPGTYYDTNGGNMRVSLFGGRFLVEAKSAKYPGTLVGEGLEGVVLAEAAKLKEVVWTKFIRPTLADYKGWALLTSTPEGKNWFYRQYMRGQDPNDPTWFSVRAPSWSNPVLFPGGRDDPEVFELGKDMSEEKFKQEIGAEFTEFVGRVFKDFSEETHVTDLPYDPSLPVYIAEDAGFRNPSVALFIQVDVFDNVNVIGEYYQREKLPDEFAQEIYDDPKLGPLARVARAMYPDPADPGTAGTLSKKFGGTPIKGSTGGSLQGRLELIRSWLRPWPLELEDGHPEKIPRLRIDRSCHNTIREFNDYRYAETKDESNASAPENPLKKDDHSPEAIGRFFAGHYAKIVQEQYKSRTSRASMGGRR